MFVTFESEWSSSNKKSRMLSKTVLTCTSFSFDRVVFVSCELFVASGIVFTSVISEAPDATLFSFPTARLHFLFRSRVLDDLSSVNACYLNSV